MSMPWMQFMPNHWAKLRAKNMFEKQYRTFRDEDDVVTCFRDGTVTLRKNRRTTGFTESTQWSGYQGIRKGDLVIHVMDAFAGAIGVSDSDGKSTPVYSVCTAKLDLNNHYYAYILREMARAGFIQSLYRGIRERSSDFRFEVFANLLLPLPPRDEQDQIVRYLDWKVSRINKLINAKRRQIELLREMKLVVVNKAVMRGGEGWSNGKIGRFYTVILGKMLQPNKKYDSDIYSNYLCAANIKWSGVRLDPLKKMWFSESELAVYRLERGDLLITEGGDVGTSCIWNNELVECYIQNSVHLVRSNQHCTKYLYYWILNLKNSGWIDNVCNKSTIAHFTKEKLANAPLFLPPCDEQKKIVGYLDQKCGKFDKIVEKLNEELWLLVEYRTRLISDVVTGKIDVRGLFVGALRATPPQPPQPAQSAYAHTNTLPAHTQSLQSAHRMSSSPHAISRYEMSLQHYTEDEE